MECEHPVWIHDPDRPLIRDNYGTDLYRMKVACGKCPACQSNHRKMWFFRLKVESNKCVSSYVVTLTYNDRDLPPLTEFIDKSSVLSYHPLRYSDIQAFHKRLRKQVGSFRFFAIGEFGSEHLRPHYHICYFFDHSQDWTEFENAVFKCWFSETRITVDQTNDKACNYILKYCLSMVAEDLPSCFRPQLRCSTKPYIGYGLLDNPEFVLWLHLNKTDISSYVGYKTRLPRIYRDKVFSDEEKKFIQQELGRALEDKARRTEEYIADKVAKYGIMKGVDYIQQNRQAFNSSIKRVSKLKSIK